MAFFELKEYDQSSIQALIDNNVEESIHLDFKDGRALDKADKKTEEIAKDVSAFANSDGGILVYGVSEKDHKADSVSGVDGDVYTKEWLEQVINSKISPRIIGITIFPIRMDGDIKNSVYVVKIPRSGNAPHMNCDHIYYRRFNFMSVKMEDFEVRDLFHRKTKCSLVISSSLFAIDLDKSDDDTTLFKFCAAVANNSHEICTLYKVNVYLTSIEKLAFDKISWDAVGSDMSYSVRNDGVKISAVGVAPLFSDECVDIGRFSIEVPTSNLEDFVNNTKVRIALMYQDGEDIFETTVKDYVKQMKDASL